jgi:hypothetical protein
MADFANDQMTKELGRQILVDALRDELLGPEGGPDEILDQQPSGRYLLGRLAPAGVSVGAEDDEGLGGLGGEGGDDGDAGPDSPISASMNPSSIGVSFVVLPGVSTLEVSLSWGDYMKIDVADHAVDDDSAEAVTFEEGIDDDLEETPSGSAQHRFQKRAPRARYKRIPKTHPSVVVAVDEHGYVPLEGDETYGVHLFHTSRVLTDGSRAMSIFLVNKRPAPVDDAKPDEETWMFQPLVEIRGASGEAVFGARGIDHVFDEGDPELNSLELLYWETPEFAIGHGCAATWESEPGSRVATMVRTDVLPEWELPRVDPRTDTKAELRMHALGGESADGVAGAQLREMLTPIADAYEEWISTHLKSRLDSADLPAKLRPTALDHIDRCELVLDRLREGIDLVSAGPDEIRRAFCFANRAMALQRERSQISLAFRRGQSNPAIDDPKWRPFQIAFMLISIPSLADRAHRDRKIADLLWFPTGGGKTEAYLGLTAFSLAHRRIRVPLPQHRNDAGLSVLMRYTLRLLTIQQFQRATALICACEHLRITEQAWGSERFSIGLWVGRSATPNVYDSDWGDNLGAKQILDKLRNGLRVAGAKGTPVQLLACPWCGADIVVNKDRQDFVGIDAREMVMAFCSSNDCFFGPSNGSGIPIHTVDQQVYRSAPSLVIATVDKFAQMPFNGRTQSLFGRFWSYCRRHGFISKGDSHNAQSHAETPGFPKVTVEPSLPLEPPDLIIQDELHLISGPLGTMVGAYESAVDFLASSRLGDELVGPKIIASTATIRRADRQVGGLFNRELAVFPAQGIRSSDSWFGQEVPLAEASGRRYVGIYAPGKSVKTALVRVYATLLSRAKAVLDESAPAGDPYMTLVGYYNSLRELGGAIRLLEDDIPGRIGVLHRRDKEKWPRRRIYEWDQLTSNKRADEVPEILGKLEREFLAGGPMAGKWPIDVLLASNMISVGVDIDRLGLMVVTGQPKTTAEYIQATSRVGRQSPGLVVCVYNWSRPRDSDHYARFRSYHSSLYRFVEATSVTPFSSRARDKALQAVLSAMIRLDDPDMTPEQNAKNLNRFGQHVKEVTSFISNRAGVVAQYSGENQAEVSAATASEIAAALDAWEASFQHDELLSWTFSGMAFKKDSDTIGVDGATVTQTRKNGQVKKRYLLQTQEEESPLVKGTFIAPSSLREVESELPVFLAYDE